MNHDKLLTLNEVLKQKNLDKQLLDFLIKQKQFPEPILIDNVWYWTAESLTQWKY